MPSCQEADCGRGCSLSKCGRSRGLDLWPMTTLQSRTCRRNWLLFSACLLSICPLSTVQSTVLLPLFTARLVPQTRLLTRFFLSNFSFFFGVNCFNAELVKPSSAIENFTSHATVFLVPHGPLLVAAPPLIAKETQKTLDTDMPASTCHDRDLTMAISHSQDRMGMTKPSETYSYS